MRLSFEQFREIFGRPAVQPGDTFAVNGTEYVVESVDSQGIEFIEADDGDDNEEEDQ